MVDNNNTIYAVVLRIHSRFTKNCNLFALSPAPVVVESLTNGCMEIMISST